MEQTGARTQEHGTEKCNVTYCAVVVQRGEEEEAIGISSGFWSQMRAKPADASREIFNTIVTVTSHMCGRLIASNCLSVCLYVTIASLSLVYYIICFTLFYCFALRYRGDRVVYFHSYYCHSFYF